jgi:hypothetical protein
MGDQRPVLHKLHGAQSYGPGAGFLRYLFSGCHKNRRTEEAHNECAASLNIVGQHRSGISMPLHLARDLSAIAKPHSEALDGYVAGVRDLAFKDFRFHHRILCLPV